MICQPWLRLPPAFKALSLSQTPASLKSNYSGAGYLGAPTNNWPGTFPHCCKMLLAEALSFLSVFTYPDNTPAAVLEHGLLAVSQSTKSIRCDIQVPGLSRSDEILGSHLRLYFDPARDEFNSHNVSSGAAAVILQSTSSPTTSWRPTPDQSICLEPGTWTIRISPLAGVDLSPMDLVDLYLQPRRSIASSLDAAPADRAGSKATSGQSRIISEEAKGRGRKPQCSFVDSDASTPRVVGR